MRVALDVTPLLGARSGVATVVQGLLGALAGAENPPEIVTWTMSGRDRSGAGIGAIPLTLPAAVAVPLWNRLGMPRVDRLLGHPDVVHGTNYVVPPSSGPTVVSAYDVSFVHDASSTSRSVRRFDASLRAAVKRGAVIHTTAEVVAEELRDRYRAVVEVVAPGVEPRLPRDEPASVPYIAGLGTSVPRKNFPLLIAAFAELAIDRPELELRIAGAAGPDSGAIEAALEALTPDVRRRAVHVGRVDDAAMASLIDGALVVAHPSRYEGFGLPILEAMSAGVPVVAAEAGAAPEVSGDAALLVPVDDVHALAAGLAKVVDDEAFAADLGQRGVKRASEFTWSRTARDMSALYDRACARR